MVIGVRAPTTWILLTQRSVWHSVCCIRWNIQQSTASEIFTCCVKVLIFDKLWAALQTKEEKDLLGAAKNKYDKHFTDFRNYRMKYIHISLSFTGK